MQSYINNILNESKI